MSLQELCKRGWDAYLAALRDVKANVDLDVVARRAFKELYSDKEAEFRKDDELRGKVSALLAEHSDLAEHSLLAEHSDKKAFDQLWLYFSPQSPQRARGEDSHTVAAAFEADYLDPDGNLSYIKQTLDQYCRDWEHSTWYSPYCSIVQSSGYGKSKTVLELAKRSVFVIYCSLMDSTSKGYPPRSVFADNYTLDRCTKVGYQRYVVACLRLIGVKEMTPEDWSKYQYWDQGTTFLRDLHEEYQKVSEECPTVSEARKELEKVHQLGGRLQFLFVFDEARKLLEHTSGGFTSFYWLRKTFRDFSENSGVFCVLMDTASIITNFAPEKSQDQSLKSVTVEGLKLFDPIYVLAVTDVFSKEIGEVQSWDDLSRPHVYLKYGRPLWGSRLHEGKDVQDVVTLAVVKLLGGVDWESDGESEVRALSVLGPLICLDVCPGTYINSRLVSNHMRMCVHVSEKRDLICSSTGLEPILAEAGLCLLKAGNNVKYLKELHKSLRAGWVEGGFRGELVARICLIFAVLHETKKLDRSWSVQEFLKFYSGNPEVCSSASGCEDLTRLLEGKVFFTGFTSAWFTPTTDELLNFFRRCSGFVCKSGQRGVDLIIPVLLRDVGEETYLLKPENMSALLVQVKNRKDKKIVDPNTIGLGHSGIELSKGTPYVSLLLELGQENSNEGSEVLVQVEGPHTRSKDESGTKTPQHHLVLDGLPAFMTDGEKDILKKILVTRQDPGTYNANPVHAKQLHKMWPLFDLKDEGRVEEAKQEGKQAEEAEGRGKKRKDEGRVEEAEEAEGRGKKRKKRKDEGRSARTREEVQG